MSEMLPTARPTVAFIGAGRAGCALATALHDAGHTITAVHSRTAERAQRLAAVLGAVAAPSAGAAAQSAEVTFLTVPDGQIAPLAATIAAGGVALRGRALVHCSATHGPAVMAAARLTAATLGAFHPLQALTGASSAALLRGTTFTVEAPADLRATLIRMARALDGEVLELPAGSRALYHAAAVLTSAGPLAILARATRMLEGVGIDRGVAHRGLCGLLAGAVSNAAGAGAEASLTGPVVRGDAATVGRHLTALADDPDLHELYRRLAIEMLALAGPGGREAVAGVLGVPGPPPPSRAPVPPRPRAA